MKQQIQSGNFRYSQDVILNSVIKGFSYVEYHKGKTSGSRVVFINNKAKHIIRLHKPHPGLQLRKMFHKINMFIKYWKF
ncbi:MAG: hypothetical protein DRP58_13100 [Spirochaetes bacterium]|nr:MAG: hypothetical protein DRP58_13100 [Spirochaetota bacterium]